MPFDANLVLANGTIDWTYVNIVDNGYGHPHSTTVDGGLVVIDLLELSGTPAKGLACILIIDEEGNEIDDALTLIIQSSDAVDFIQTSSNDVRTLAAYDIKGEAAGIIVGDECPCTVIRRIVTTQRYIRPYATMVSGDNFHTVHILLAPWPFHVL